MENNHELEKHKKKADVLFQLEQKLKELHKDELKSYFQIGATLNHIKERKLYYYKDTEGNYTWEFWCREFYGSRRTAERYIDLWHIFIRYYKYPIRELQDIHYSRLAMTVPLLKSGEAKDKSDVDKIVEMARTAPSDTEFRNMIFIKDLPTEDIHECEHIFYYYIRCKVCGERKKVARSSIINPEEIEKKF